MQKIALGRSHVAVEYEGRYHVIESQVVDADVIPVLGLQTATAYMPTLPDYAGVSWILHQWSPIRVTIYPG